MDMRVKYQYTYFIYPFVVEKNEYFKYIKSLLKNENCKIDIFEKTKDLELYTHFLPEISEKMFPTFELSKRETCILKSGTIKAKEKIIKEMNCIQFEYMLNQDINQEITKESIYFYVDKIKIICFNTRNLLCSYKNKFKRFRKIFERFKF